MTKKLKLIPGAPVRTNAAFAGLTRFPKAWTGVLLRQHATIAGSWWVEITSPKGLPHQVINAKYMEAEA